MSWATEPLGSLATIVAGGTPSRSQRSNFEGYIPWVKISDMLQGIVLSTDERISDVGLGSSSAKVLPAGTLLLSIFATVGRTAVLGISAATNQAIAGITPLDNDELDSGYLRRYLDSAIAELVGKARGAAQVNINLSILRALRIPLPPLLEQRRIATILDQADELRTQRRRALALLEEFIESLFMNMFGSLESSSEQSVYALLKDAKGAIRTGPFGSDLLHSEFVEEGISVLGIDNVVQNEFVWAKPRFITPEKYQKLNRYTVNPGDVLVTIMGTVGRCAVVPEGIPTSINTKHLCCLTLESSKCLPEYLHHYFLRHPRAKQYLASVSKGAIMAGLNLTLIRSMPVLVPPIASQLEFAERLADLSSLKAMHERELSHLDELFASLQHRAFRGEL